MPEQPMSPRLEHLYLKAVTSGWWLDWNRYYAADEAEREARLAVLQIEASASGASTGKGA
jgi:hypothetical protein